jgi:hypothetical protein
VLDGEEDLDDDGLGNRDEFDLETDPEEADSDDDGVLDGDEDSDDDGFTDGEECERGSDPRHHDGEDEDGDFEDGDDEDGDFEDGDDVGEGTVEAFDPETGQLVFSVASGFTVVVTVTDGTEIAWAEPGCGDTAGIADLNPGQALHEVRVADTEDPEEIPVAEAVELACE